MPIYFPFRSGDDSVELTDLILPVTTIEFIYEGTDLTKFVKEVRISGGRGAPVRGTVVLKDYDTDTLATLASQFNQTHSAYRAHNMTDSRKLSLTLTQGENSVAYPDLIPDDPSWDNDATLTWSFTDMTPIANKDNQNIGDYLYSEGDDVTSHDVIDDIAAHAGVAIVPEFSPFNIGTFRANETNILSALDELKTVKQAYNKWESDTLHLNTLDEQSPVWHIVDRLHIPDGGMTVALDSNNIRTRFNFFRDKPLASVLGRANCTGKLGEESPCVGRVVQVNFNRPTKHAIITIISTQFGEIGEGVFYDEAGDPLPSPDELHFYGPDEAVMWLGTYTPLFSLGTDMYVPSWDVIATGGALTTPEDVSFTVSKILTELETIYGSRPEYKDLETELVRDEETAQAMLDAIALEILWSIRKFNLNTPFLIPGREGDFVGVTHGKHGLVDEDCLIQTWDHSYSEENGWNNSYELRAKIA